MHKIICLILFSISFSSTQAQYITIPDTNFRNKLIQLYPACFNVNQQMDTTCSTIVNEISLDICCSNITRVDGLQYFENLDTLKCYMNQIDTLSHLPNTIVFINCYNSQVKYITALPDSLIYFNCYLNQLHMLPALPSSLKHLVCMSNQLDSLPALPNSIARIDCYHNHLTFLPLLPDSLEFLYCSDNQIGSLSTLPNHLISLYCEGNNLTSLPPLPNSLLNLTCASNFIDSLPALPNSIVSLNCRENLLTFLPVLPNSLSTIWCHQNQISFLPDLPASLTEFRCGYNSLTTLPALPNSLAILDCGNNQLSSLPTLNGSLWQFGCSNNPLLTCLPLLPPSLWYLDYSGTAITCIPNNPNNIPFGLMCTNAYNCEPNPFVSGIVYEDKNNNLVYDAGTDYYISYWDISNSNGWFTKTDTMGRYYLKLDSGIVNTFTLVPQGPYFSFLPAAYSVTPATGGNQGTNFDFAVQINPTATSTQEQYTNFTLFPNPTNGKAIVKMSDEHGTLFITNVFGEFVQKLEVRNGSEIDLCQFKSGLFFGRLETEEGTKVVKILKE